jgi:hypothetical protein
MKQPPVTSIHVEYADGSVDDMKLIHRGVCPLFNWKRQRPSGETQASGAYTSGAIAIILLRTAALTQLTDYPFKDPKLVAALKPWFDELHSQQNQQNS